MQRRNPQEAATASRADGDGSDYFNMMKRMTASSNASERLYAMKSTIWFLPMEPYDGRYTASWIKWWSAALDEVAHTDGVDTMVIEGVQLSPTIRTGAKLDGIGTCYWKSTQLAHLIVQIESGAVRDGDLIFTADVWYPGLEMLDYIRKIAGRQYLIGGILHGGSYHSGDYTHQYGIDHWAKYSENAWLHTLDAIFVASKYHRDIVLDHYPELADRLFADGLPFWPEEIWDGTAALPKENIIVFPHDIDRTKGYAAFTAFRDRVQNALPGWQWIASREVTHNRPEYYDLLRRSKIAVSFATHETFGYSMLEAAAANCHILAPSCLSYVDIFPQETLWSTESDLERRLLEAAAGNLVSQRSVAMQFRYTANDILRRMLQCSPSLLRNDLRQPEQRATRLI